MKIVNGEVVGNGGALSGSLLKDGAENGISKIIKKVMPDITRLKKLASASGNAKIKSAMEQISRSIMIIDLINEQELDK